MQVVTLQPIIYTQNYKKRVEKNPCLTIYKEEEEMKRKPQTLASWFFHKVAPSFTTLVLLASLSLREQHTQEWIRMVERFERNQGRDDGCWWY